MTDPGENNIDESKKRKLTSAIFLRPEQEESSSSSSSSNSEDLHPSESSTSADISAPGQGPYKSKKLCTSQAKQRQELEKYICNVVTETNYQRDLNTQRQLAAIQAENDDSDDEPTPRRMRLNDLSPDNQPTSAVSSSMPFGVKTKKLRFADHTVIIEDLTADSDSSSDLSSTNPNDESCDLAIRLQRYHEQYLFNNSSEQTNASSSEVGIIPLPGTSNSTASIFNSVNPTTEEHHHYENVPMQRTDIEECPPSPENVPSSNSSSSSEDTDTRFLVIEITEGVEPDATTVRIIGIDHDDYYPSFPFDEMVETRDDEEYMQIVRDIANCYISVENRRINSSSHVDLLNSVMPNVLQPVVPSGPPLSSFRREQRNRRYGYRARGSWYTLGGNGPPYAITSDEIFPTCFYMVGTNDMFNPLEPLNEQPFFDFENLVHSFRSLSPSPPTPPRPSMLDLAGPSTGMAAVARRLPISSRILGARFRQPRIRSISIENLQPDLNGEIGTASNNNRAIALPGRLTRSSSIPELNVIGNCPICTKGLHKEEVASTFCGHLFCMTCIRRAIIINGKRCPTCRRPLPGDCFHPVYF